MRSLGNIEAIVNVPVNRQFVDLLIGKYTQENTIEIIEVGAKHRMLCYLAMSLHKKLKQSISKDDLYILIDEYAQNRGHTAKAQYDFGKPF